MVRGFCQLWEWELLEQAQILFEVQLVGKDCGLLVEELGARLRGSTVLKRVQTGQCTIRKAANHVHCGLDLPCNRLLVGICESGYATHLSVDTAGGRR